MIAFCHRSRHADNFWHARTIAADFSLILNSEDPCIFARHRGDFVPQPPRRLGMKRKIFRKMKKMALARRQLLPFVHTIECFDIVIAIGEAHERGEPLGLKQLSLLQLAPASTLQRRLTRLVNDKVIKKVVVVSDGRRVAYSPTVKTIHAYEKFARVAGLEY